MSRIVAGASLIAIAVACDSNPTDPLTKPHVADDFAYTLVRVPASYVASATLVDRANKAGDVVGRYLVGTGTEWHGFALRGGSFEKIDVTGASRTLPHGLNNAGDVVGRYFTGTLEHGFLYSKGVYTTFDAPGSSGTRFYDISAGGTIAGSYRVGTGSYQPAIWVNGVFTPLSAMATAIGANMAEGLGINAAGDVVGHFTKAGDAKMYGFYYTASATTTLEHPESGQGTGMMSCAFGIGPAGDIVGHYTDTVNGGVSGFIWNSGQFVGKLRVPGATETYPQAITSNGIIAGYAILASGERVGFTAVLK
jgi:hypothetical protein